MKITKLSNKGLQLIKQFESFKSNAYLCPSGVPTIGYGSTYYIGGKKVKLSDPPISEQQAEILLKNNLITFEKGVDSYTRDDINQNQFDALCVFAYNAGMNALKTSTLLKKVNANPNDQSIRLEFMKWVYGNGEKLPGLIKRREQEANLYYES